MLSNKKFITVIGILLIAVFIYDVNFFMKKKGVTAAEADDGADFPDYTEYDNPQAGQDEGDEVAKDGFKPLFEFSKGFNEDSKLIVKKTSLLLKRYDRNPFFVKGEVAKEVTSSYSVYGNKSGTSLADRAGKNAKQPDTAHDFRNSDTEPITSKRIKMIFIANRRPYVMIDGGLFKEGDHVGREVISSIRDDYILLTLGGKTRKVSIKTKGLYHEGDMEGESSIKVEYE